MIDNKAEVSNLIEQTQNDPLTYNKGKVEATLNNFIWILEHDSNLDNIKFNGLRGALVVTGPVPWHRQGSDASFSAGDMARLEQYLEKHYEGLSSSAKVEKALAALQHSSKYFDPVREYFDSLPDWDGKERLDTLLIDSFQAEDSSYTRAVTRKTFCAIVARQYEPAKKFDNMLILVGKQGTGKSSFLERITPMGAYTDNVSMEDLGDSKIAGEKIRENILVEIPELSGMRKADIEKIKAFLTRQEDQFRPAYGRDLLRLKRRCVIVGTTNNFEGFLRDEQNRRFWPVYIKKTEKTMVALTEETVKQIWAEAKKRYQEGEKLYLDNDADLEQAEAIQNASLETNGLEDVLREFLDTPVPADWDNWNKSKRLLYWKELAARGQIASATGKAYHNLYGQFNDWTAAQKEVVEALKHPEELELRTYVGRKEIWVECFGQPLEEFATVKNKEEKTNIKRAMIKLGWEPEAETRTRRATGYGVDRGFRRTVKASVIEKDRLRVPAADDERAANLRALEVDETTADFVKKATDEALKALEIGDVTE